MVVLKCSQLGNNTCSFEVNAHDSAEVHSRFQEHARKFHPELLRDQNLLRQRITSLLGRQQ